MHTKQLFTIFTASILCGTYSIAIEPITTSLALFGAASKAAPIVGNYLYSTEDRQKLIKKHLHTRVAAECEKYLSQNCSDLAIHYENLEAYHRIATLQRELSKTKNPQLRQVIEQSIKTAQELKIKNNIPDDNGSYLQALPQDKQNEAYALMGRLIEENKIYGIDNYSEELQCLNASLSK